MEMPGWLRTGASDESRVNSLHVTGHALRKNRKDRFLDKTLSHVLSFVEDTMFNERTSRKNGLLQKIGPRLKIVSLLSFVVVLSLQKSLEGIVPFLVVSFFLVVASKVPPLTFAKKLLPPVAFTLFISIPVVLNLVVEGEPLLVLLRTGEALRIGPFQIPEEIAITSQGVKTAITLCARVLASVSFVFLMTMTTPPNTLMKSLSAFFPGSLKPVVSISYRYIFFLLRRVEHFVMGLTSRKITALNPSKGRHWVASRIGVLFSMSMELSKELTMAMESRGYKGAEVRGRKPGAGVRGVSGNDISWALFAILFCGVMIWKSFV
jgi:cobalt/nickel transport system permease protein